MDFEIKNIEKSITEIARGISYLIIDSDGVSKYNLVRKIQGDTYPRFHIYLKQHGQDFVFSLHLDQKKPVYKGAHAHQGEYFGPVVEAEADRIKTCLQ